MNDSQHTGPRVFFFSTLHTPFIQQDEELLSERYHVETLIDHGLSAVARIPRGVARSGLSFLWFGSVYAGWAVFLARSLKRKSLVVIGGVDAAKEKEIHYGIWLSPWKRIFVRYALRHADRLLVVDPFFQREVVRLAEYDGRNIVYVPTGYDPSVWTPGAAKKKMVLTVAACHDTWRMKKKGIDKLFAAAGAMPLVHFRLIGLNKGLLPLLRETLPKNVEVIPYVAQDQLITHYQQAKVYCQPSYTEGLPNSLCEAMLCGCIPVGTRVGGIPTAIGTTGYLVDYSDQDGLVQALHRALAAPSAHGLKARERVKEEFTLARRKRSLYQVIDELTG